MGKNLTSQKRGKGSHTYRAPSFNYQGRAEYRKLDDAEKTASVEGNVIDIVHCAGHSAPLMKVRYIDGQDVLMIATDGIKVITMQNIDRSAMVDFLGLHMSQFTFVVLLRVVLVVLIVAIVRWFDDARVVALERLEAASRARRSRPTWTSSGIGSPKVWKYPGLTADRAPPTRRQPATCCTKPSAIICFS